MISLRVSAIHYRLKEATRPYHDRLESQLPLNNPELSSEYYREILEDFYGLYVPLEDAFLKQATDSLYEQVLSRRKVPWLIEDLTHLGLTSHDIRSLALCLDLPRITTEAELLGSLYVVEGATLGGQVVSEWWSRSRGSGSLKCNRFFQSYGKDVARKWQSFLELLPERIDTGRKEEEAVRTACATFVAFERWLTRPQKTLRS